MSSLIQLAIGLVIDLKINKPQLQSNAKQSYLLNATTTEVCRDPTPNICHSSEVMRAFLGCFYLSSVFVDSPVQILLTLISTV